MKLHRMVYAGSTLFLFAGSLSAQFAHTWVSGNGSDSGSGTVTSPYATFQKAVSETTVGGMVSVVGLGDFGPVTITQSITIDGTGGGSITFTGGEGVYIDTTPAATVILRNLTINGGGVGTDAIFMANASTNALNVIIENCVLAGFTQIGIGLGSEATENVLVRDTTISGGTLGVRTFQNGTTPPVTSYDHVSLDHVTIQGATQQAVFSRNGNVDISNSNLFGNGTAIEADTYATLNIQNSMITNNADGVCIFATSTALLNNTDVFDNATEIESCGGTVEGPGGVGPSPAPSPAPQSRIHNQHQMPDIPRQSLNR